MKNDKHAKKTVKRSKILAGYRSEK